MRVKLLNILTVCIVTLAVISPELVVVGVVWERHMELVKSQNLACEVNKNTTGYRVSSFQSEGKNSSQFQTSIQTSDRNVINQFLTVANQYKLATVLQWFFLLIPVCVGLGVIFYDRYLVYRASVLKEQVEMLERLWQQSIEQ